jgi:hypothetical protein
MSDPEKYANIVSLALAKEDQASRIRLVPFDEIKLGTRRRDLVKGIIPRVGLTVVWGKPKCGKSFWLFDCLMHVALGWEYRGRRVHQGPVVYCSFEGQSGLEARVEAFRLARLDSYSEPVPFYLQPVTLNLVKDHQALIKIIRDTLGDQPPAAVALDTLNRSMPGSESSDEDMSAYVKATDAIREAFECSLPIVHHCGHNDTRPRGHSSLIGALDAQIQVSRDASDRIIAEVELAKDGPQGLQLFSSLEVVTVGIDEDGEEITSCVVRPEEVSAQVASKPGDPKLSPNQKTLFSMVHAAGSAGLTLEDWNQQAREAGIGVKRKADLNDIRAALLSKQLVRSYGDRWHVQND